MLMASICLMHHVTAVHFTSAFINHLGLPVSTTYVTNPCRPPFLLKHYQTAAVVSDIDDLFAGLKQKKKKKEVEEEKEAKAAAAAQRIGGSKKKIRHADDDIGGGGGGGGMAAAVGVRYNAKRDDPDVRPCT